MKTVFYSGQDQIMFSLLKKTWNCNDSDHGNDLFNPDQDKPSEPRTCSMWQVCFQGKPWVTWKIPACRAENLALLVFPSSFCSWWTTGSEDYGGDLSFGTQKAGQVNTEMAWCYSLVLGGWLNSKHMDSYITFKLSTQLWRKSLFIFPSRRPYLYSSYY